MNIYELQADGDFDRLFFADGDDIIPAMDAADGLRRLSTSHTIPLKENPKEVNRTSLLTHCVNLLGGALLVSEYAISVLHVMLADAGYIVPTVSQIDVSYGLFICEREVDAYDVERSESAPHSPVDQILRYELRGEMLAGLDIFRLRCRRARLFVSDRFKQAVDADPRLTGFVFRHIWSSESGGVQYPFVPFNTYEDVPGTIARARKAKRDAMRERIARERL